MFIDFRGEGKNRKRRKIDVLEDRSMQSTPGKILKTEEVEVASYQTSLVVQTYTFNFQMYHAVPLGGYFSILLSLKEKNGVSITNAQDVETNCIREMPDGSLLGTNASFARPIQQRRCLKSGCSHQSATQRSRLRREKGNGC